MFLTCLNLNAVNVIIMYDINNSASQGCLLPSYFTHFLAIILPHRDIWLLGGAQKLLYYKRKELCYSGQAAWFQG